ncbi:MAG TPA: transglutaminase-like domain-containing protein, partial [Thermoanaerobaculia bacterium]|nr:transglutaminase-like domain-containing protein [Thermoanaerobaculia bacterium]
EIAPAGKPPLERIRAIAEYVQQEIRYVAIEIGIGGYQPHPAADIFKKQFGDCKDKVTLLRTMLRAAGFESYYVMVNADRGVVDPAFATPYLFDHAIIAIRVPASDGLYTTLDHARGKLLFFDPTSASTPFGTLPAYEQQGSGLLVLDNGGELVTLPSAPPQASQLRRHAKLALDANGVLSGEVEEVRSGNMAAELRRNLQPLSAVERARWVDTVVGAHLTDAAVQNLSIENVDRSTADVVIRYHLVAHNYITRAAELSLIRPRVLGEKAEPQIGGRKQTYETGGPSLQTDDIEIAVAPTLVMSELPPAVSIHTAPLTYESKATFDGNTLHYRREYTVLAHTIPVAGIEEANHAFAKIAAAERSTAIFVEKP